MLYLEVVIVKASKQVDTQPKAFPAVTVGFFKDPKDLPAANDVLCNHAFAGQSAGEHAKLWGGQAAAATSDRSPCGRKPRCQCRKASSKVLLST